MAFYYYYIIVALFDYLFLYKNYLIDLHWVFSGDGESERGRKSRFPRRVE